MDTFGEFSRTLFVHENSSSWVNAGGGGKAPARFSKHCSVFSVRSGGVGVKPLLGSVDTVLCQG